MLKLINGLVLCCFIVAIYEYITYPQPIPFEWTIGASLGWGFATVARDLIKG